jgi:polysaccharide pyruvyl transferase WcaK-like protein
MPHLQARRRFLATSLGASLLPAFAWARDERPRRILLRSSWQTVNIGDIGHTPGILALLHEHLPDAEITLWPSNIGNGVEELLRRSFPKLRIAQGPAVEAALADCDFFLHGSGASLVAQKDLARWKKATGKPYGIYGITLSSVDTEARRLINDARFLYLRDSVSLQFAKDQGLKCPIIEFAPDAAFGVTLRNDAAAAAFLGEHGLEEGKFLCVIPRLRYTPYWIIRKKPMTDEDHRKHERNEEMKEHDHAPLREAIIAVTRQAGLKVLVCPEDESQMAVGKAMLVDPLPDDVKAKVVWRDKYWLTDEALSTYVRSAGLFGLEMHSPIMAVGNGVPAVVCRFKEQTSKGLMWRDIGLGDWLFDMDEEEDVANITRAVLAIAQDPAAARARASRAREIVRRRQRETMGVVAKNVRT